MQNKRSLKTMYCVIAGDIIESDKIADRNQAYKKMRDILNYINTEYMPHILAGLGLVRGDAFEGVLLSQYQAPQNPPLNLV